MFFRPIQAYQNGTFRSISHFIICVKFVRSLKNKKKTGMVLKNTLTSMFEKEHQEVMVKS